MISTPDCKFDDYLKEKKHNDIQKNITQINEELRKCNEPINIIYYGPNGVGKYSCALDYISRFSQSGLTYEKKMTVETAKGSFILKISDIHFEIDFGILGVNAKQLWNDIITHISDVLAIRKDKHAFILCKNFHEIHGELLDIFYSYMQTTQRQTNLKYILLTNSTGFIPIQVINKCLTISVPRPTKVVYSTVRKIGKFDNININEIENINLFKSCQTNELQSNLVKKLMEKVVNANENINVNKKPDEMTEELCQTFDNDYSEMRDYIYDIFVSNHNVWNILWCVVYGLINDSKIREDKAQSVLQEAYCFLELYNNNYRPIYHLERFMYFLAITINEL